MGSVPACGEKPVTRPGQAADMELDDVPDEILYALWRACSRDPEARQILLREARRRDARDRRSRADTAWYAQMRSDWELLAHADYLRADKECRGHLLSRAGDEEGVIPWPSLWQGSETWARRRASEELCQWWDLNGRLTVTKVADHDKHTTMRSPGASN